MPNKQTGHRSKPGNPQRYQRQPAGNRGVPGQVAHAYPDLFPAEWKALGEKLRQFDTAWFRAHPDVDEFAREYVPGEAYPQHDPEIRYVMVKRFGNTRVRGMTPDLPQNLPFVELPPDL